MVTHLRVGATLALFAGVLTIALDLGYMLVARLRGHRGLLKVGVGLLVPFVGLVLLFFADFGLFAPRV